MKKALVIKICCIGDIIQTTPALRALYENNYEVHFLYSPWVKELIQMIPFVHKGHEIDTSKKINLLKTLVKLRKEKFDIIINYHRNIKSYLFAYFIGAKQRIGFKWKWYEKFLTKSYEFDFKKHEVDRYLTILEGEGIKINNKNTYLELKDNIKQNNDMVNIGLFPGGGKNPGTVMSTKRWPTDYFVKLINELKKNNNIEIFIIGGKGDDDIVDYISNIHKDIKIIKTNSLYELALTIKNMDIFIAGDTGPLHMSAALGVNTIGLFGPSSPELVKPRGKNTKILWGKTDCSPCYIPETVFSKKFLNCKDNICMKKIKVDDVLKLIKEFL